MTKNQESIREVKAIQTSSIAGGEIEIYEARPSDPAQVRGGILVIQEIFGVNSHIRSVADRYAHRGFVAWAPALFDRAERGVELSYDTPDFAKGRDIAGQLKWDQPLSDLRRAAEKLRAHLPAHARGLGAVGYCWGGSLAWLAACRLGDVIDAAVCYYGRATHDFRSEERVVPALLHFGEHDSSIPMSNVDEFRTAQPDSPIFVYDAHHGFNCDQRKDYNPGAAKLALTRTEEFLAAHLL